MKNPCEECLVRVRCCKMCEKVKPIWGKRLNNYPNALSALAKLSKELRVKKTIYWWFEKLIEESKERKML